MCAPQDVNEFLLCEGLIFLRVDVVRGQQGREHELSCGRQARQNVEIRRVSIRKITSGQKEVRHNVKQAAEHPEEPLFHQFSKSC